MLPKHEYHVVRQRQRPVALPDRFFHIDVAEVQMAQSKLLVSQQLTAPANLLSFN